MLRIMNFSFQFFLLRKLMQGEKSDPRAPLGGNFRPTQPQNSRTVRTNVAVRPDRVSEGGASIHPKLRAVGSKILYRVTHHVDSNLPFTSKQKF